MNKAVFEMILLTCIAIFLGLILNFFSPFGIPLFGQWQPEIGSVHAGGPCKPQIEEAHVNDISNLYLDENVVFVDARSHEDYIDGHIPRAISLPIAEFNTRHLDFIEQISFDQPIITYCSGVDCHDSHTLAKNLKEIGYSNIQVYARGMENWIAAGRPINEGEIP